VSCASVSLGILRICAAAALPVQLLEWDSFDIFTVAQLSRQRPLQTVTWALLHHFNVVGDLSLPPDKLRGFLRVRRHGGPETAMRATAKARRSPHLVGVNPSKICLSSSQSAHMLLQALEGGYNKNPYHNATHAADVTQNVGVMLAADDLPSKLSKLEVLAMLLAAAVHDVNHPGEYECCVPWNCSNAQSWQL
jgi:calcium/calmodulin-dependent 3',5'-cyclic nucleotide phosphodiesterase